MADELPAGMREVLAEAWRPLFPASYELHVDKQARDLALLIALHERALIEALETAADDLGKAANQFAGMRATQQEEGFSIAVERNPEIFAAKEARARAVLTSLEARADGGEDA